MPARVASTVLLVICIIHLAVPKGAASFLFDK